MTLVLHGPSYNPALPLIIPEKLAADINNELTTFWLPLSGGTATGPILLWRDPVDPMEAATKRYVQQSGARIGSSPPGDVSAPLWWDDNSGQLFIEYNDGNSIQWVAATSIDASSLEGSFLKLTGGSMTGTISQHLPGSGPVLYPTAAIGFNQQIELQGTTPDGFPGPEGYSVSANMLWIEDRLTHPTTPPYPGNKRGQSILYNVHAGSGSANGHYVIMQFVPDGPYPFSPGTQFGAMGGLVQINGNVTGGTAGGGTNPDFYGGGMELRQNAGPGNTPTFTNMLVGWEVDVSSSAPVGSTANWMWGIKIGMGGAGAIAPSNEGAFITLNGSANGNTKVPYGILFDNLQSNSPPIATTGTAIFTHAATMLSFIDASAATFTGSFIKGPNGFSVANNNTVHTDALFAVTGDALSFVGNGGRVGLQTFAGASAINFLMITSGNVGVGPVLSAGTQGGDANIDISVQPFGTGQFNIAGTAATTATAPASFSANRRVQIKINGTSYWLPASTVAW